MRLTALASVGLSMCLVSMACGHSNPVEPTTPANPTVPAPTAANRVQGRVIDATVQAVPRSRVDIVEGPGAGASVAADELGLFTLDGPFAAGAQLTLHASKEGYLDTTRTVDVPLDIHGGSVWAELQVRSLSPADLTGRYRATFTSASECSANLPEAARSRIYEASIVRAYDQEHFSGTVMIAPGTTRGFSAAVAGSRARFWFGDLEFDLIGVLEDLGPGYLSIAGEAATTVSSGRIAGTLQGLFMYCPREGAQFPWPESFTCRSGLAQSCNSLNHQLLLSAQ